MTPNVIDFCLTKEIPLGHLLEEQNLDLFSDHSPIIITLSSTIINIKQCLLQTSRPMGNDLKIPSSIDRFGINIPLKTADEIDVAIENLTIMIQQAAWDSNPEAKANNQKQNCFSKIK